MAVGEDTYAGDLLKLCGGANVFAKRAERRYPLVPVEEIVAEWPEVVVLPDEPYLFGPKHGLELQGAGLQAPFVCIDGKDLSWYGPRIPGALARLCALQRG